MMFGCDDCKCPANSSHSAFHNEGVGACNIDTTPPEVLDQYAEHCGFIRVNDAWAMWKHEVPYKDLNCGHCEYYAGEAWGVCTNEQVKPHPKGTKINGETTYTECKEYYSGCSACGSFIKRGSEKVPKKQYWTKCGRKFEKNSTAETTGYEIDLNDKDCADCPFQVDVKEGWPQVHKRWECRAGSKEPNHTNDWIGSLEDKNSIKIRSLDNNFLEAIREYCKADPELSDSYNQDIADCRRVLSIICSPNKKGIAAKKALIDKFFPGNSCQKDKSTPSCGDCHSGHWYSGDHTYVSVVQGNGIDTIKEPCEPKTHYCDNCDQKRKKIASDEEFNPDSAPDWCPRAASNVSPKASAEKTADKPWHPKCPYLMSMGLFTINCGRHAHPIVDKGFQSEGERREHSDIYCFDNFDLCETYQKAYAAEMNSTDKNVKEYRECAYCCNNSGYTGLKDSARGTKYGFCQVYQEEREKFNPDTVCEWYNRLKREDEEQMVSEKQKCKSKNKTCGYYCKHNDGCALLIMTGSAMESALKNFGQVDCDVWRKVSGHGESHPDAVDTTDITRAESADVTPFDYSTVDSETAEFLQEKANKITEIRIKSVIAIGKELKEAHTRLANNKTGIFGKWAESIGISRDTAENYLRAYNYIAENFGNIGDAEKIQPSLLFAASKPSAPKELAEKVASGDITSHKQYKELEKRLKEAEERAERAVKQKFVSDGKTIDAENKARKAIQEKTDALKAYERDLNNLHQQLDQAKRNSDPAKVQELGERIAEYQCDIGTYQQQIGNLNIQLAEKERQLKAKPIEVPATQVKEIIPDEIKLAIYRKIESLCESVVNLTKEEIQIFAQHVAPDDMEIVREELLSASRIFEQIEGAVNENYAEESEPEEEADAEPNGHCGDCVHADMDNITPEQVENATPLCTITNTIVDFDHTCSWYKKCGGRP